MYSIGWFSTAKGQGSRNLLTSVQESIARGDIDARIEFVFLSREPGESVETDKFIELARSYGIPCHPLLLSTLPQRAWHLRRAERYPSDWRLDYDRQVMKRLEQYPQA